MPILHWESWPLTSLPLFLIFSFIIYSLETPWWDIQKPWEHNRASGWPWSSHPWSILKKTYFPIWSLSPTPHLPGFNNVLQEGSQLCQWRMRTAAARQGGWALLAEHPRLCWAQPKPDHCKKFLELNFFFLGGAWTGPHRNTTSTSSCNALGQPQREGSLVSNPTCSQSLENIWREKKM